MKIIKQSWEFLNHPDAELILKSIEVAGRVCYRTDSSATVEGTCDFVRNRITTGHHSVIEHQSISVIIITDRGVTHEIVRHRLASYSQESTRYCNYSKDRFGNEITVVLPVWFSLDKDDDNEEFLRWYSAMRESEVAYFDLLELGQTPQQARSVLPNSLKTEIVMTANLREWRHFFSLRCSPAAHPQMRSLAVSMLMGFKKTVPVIFDDIYPEPEETSCQSI